MSNGYLTREDAPTGPEAWKALDDTMIQAARSVLTGRRLLHIEGPYGLGLKYVPMQDNIIGDGIMTSGCIPLAYLQKTFEISKRDLAAYEREGLPINANAVAIAALKMALTEDNVIFYGTPGAPGLTTAPGVREIALGNWDNIGAAAADIITSVTFLDKAGFHGPYSLALAPWRYNLLLRLYPNSGITELEHVRTVVNDGVYKAPILDKGGVLIASGSQYASVILGQDMSVGFLGPIRGDCLEFSITESLAPWIKVPQAVCVLKE
jgi:uncharacterized linocin/CFP29 family protein